MTSLDAASELAQNLVEVADSFGTRTRALLTDMSQPLGFAVGNTLEVVEAIETLKGAGPADFRELCESLAVQMLILASPRMTPLEAQGKISTLLASGQALQRFGQMVEAQGGNPRIIDRYDLLPHSPHRHVVTSRQRGYLFAVDTRSIGFASMNLGAGRTNLSDRVDPSAGLMIHKKTGDWIETGEPLCTIYCGRDDQLAAVMIQAKNAFQIGERKAEATPLVRRIIESRPAAKRAQGARQSRQEER